MTVDLSDGCISFASKGWRVVGDIRDGLENLTDAAAAHGWRRLLCSGSWLLTFEGSYSIIWPTIGNRNGQLAKLKNEEMKAACGYSANKPGEETMANGCNETWKYK